LRANAKFIRSRICDDIWNSAAAGDAVGALGLLVADYQQAAASKPCPVAHAMRGAYLGPAVCGRRIRIPVAAQRPRYTTLAKMNCLEAAARALAAKSGGCFQCRWKFDPRLGHGSIVWGLHAHPHAKMLKLKSRIENRFAVRATILRPDPRLVSICDVDSPYRLLGPLE